MNGCYGRNKNKLYGRVSICYFYFVALLVFLVKRFSMRSESQIATFWELAPFILLPLRTSRHPPPPPSTLPPRKILDPPLRKRSGASRDQTLRKSNHCSSSLQVAPEILRFLQQITTVPPIPIRVLRH